MLAETSQLYARFPHPWRMSGSADVLSVVLPKLASDMAPHSPLAMGLVRSQSGLKSRFASAHDRVTVPASRLTGLPSLPNGPVPTPPATMYLLSEALIAVF